MRFLIFKILKFLFKYVLKSNRYYYEACIWESLFQNNILKQIIRFNYDKEREIYEKLVIVITGEQQYIITQVTAAIFLKIMNLYTEGLEYLITNRYFDKLIYPLKQLCMINIEITKLEHLAARDDIMKIELVLTIHEPDELV